MRKKEFAIATIDLDYEIFVVYVTTLNINCNTSDEIYLS